MLSYRIMCDEDWDRIKDLLPGKEGDGGVAAKDNRLFVEAVLWVARTGTPWPDLPAYFGKWNSVWRRFDRWAARGVWERVLRAGTPATGITAGGDARGPAVANQGLLLRRPCTNPCSKTWWSFSAPGSRSMWELARKCRPCVGSR